MSDKKEKWCPTMSGSTAGYKPEYRKKGEGDDEWKALSINHDVNPRSPTGVLSKRFDNIPATLFMQTYEQAWALAWMFAAEAAGNGECVDVRVQMYNIVFDLKAQKTKELYHGKDDSE